MPVYVKESTCFTIIPFIFNGTKTIRATTAIYLKLDNNTNIMAIN